MTDTRCIHCGYCPPDPVAYHERTAELAVMLRDIRALKVLVREAYEEGGREALRGRPHWELSAAFRALGDYP